MKKSQKKQPRISSFLFVCVLMLLAVSCKSATEEETVNDGSDLNTSVVGVMTGSLGEMYLIDNYPGATLQCYDDITDAVAALKYGKVKYVMTAYTNAVNAIKRNPELAILPHNYTNEGAVVAFPKGTNSELRDRVNVVLSRYREDGTLDSIVNRWINAPLGQYPDIDVPQNKDGKVLTVGISASREPMCFIKDGRISGLDCELISRIAYELGYRLQFMDMKFAALVTSLASGRVDAVISNFTATAERAKAVDFSEEYFLNPQILMNRVSVSDSIVVVSERSWWSRMEESFQSNLVAEKRYLLILNGLKVTFIIAILSAILGTILGGFICFMRMSSNKIVKGIAKTYIDLLRGIPHVVLLMIMFYIVFASSGLSGVVVASITFAMNFAAYVSEMFRTSIESISPGQNEAGLAMGFGKVGSFVYIVLPQAMERVLPIYKGELISLVKMTSIVGYIAVQDLTKAGDIIRSRTFDAFFPLIMVAIIYFLLAWLLGYFLGRIKVGKIHR